PRQVAQPELPQPLQPKAAAQTPCHQVAGGLGDQYLPAVRGCLHPGTPVDRRVAGLSPPGPPGCAGGGRNSRRPPRPPPGGPPPPPPAAPPPPAMARAGAA